MSPEIGDAAEEFFERRYTPKVWRVRAVCFVIGWLCWVYRAQVRSAWCFIGSAGACRSAYDPCVAGLRADECTQPNWRGITMYPNQEIVEPVARGKKFFVLPRRKIAK